MGIPSRNRRFGREQYERGIPREEVLKLTTRYGALGDVLEGWDAAAANARKRAEEEAAYQESPLGRLDQAIERFDIEIESNVVDERACMRHLRDAIVHLREAIRG